MRVSVVKSVVIENSRHEPGAVVEVDSGVGARLCEAGYTVPYIEGREEQATIEASESASTRSKRGRQNR